MKNVYRPITFEDKLYIPDWCHEDTPIDYDYKDGNHYVRLINNPERIKMDYTTYKNIRRSTYFACRWYPELIKNSIPTIPSIIIRSNLYDIREDLKDALEQYPDYKFVRLCGSSPKDVIDIPIFNNYKEASDAIYRSNRTMNIAKNYDHCHLFLRKVIELDNECRCIVHNKELRAVSMYHWIPDKERIEIENNIKHFFEKYKSKLPYNSTVLELGWGKNKEPFIVEFNSFGIDGFADSSLFNWDNETNFLYFSKTPVFRYPNEYDFTC